MTRTPTKEELRTLYYKQSQVVTNLTRALHKEKVSLQKIRDLISKTNRKFL